MSGVSVRLIRRLLAQRKCSVGLAWRQRLVLLSGVSLTGGYRAVGQRDRLTRKRCLSERVTSPQVVGPADTGVRWLQEPVLSALSGAGLVGCRGCWAQGE